MRSTNPTAMTRRGDPPFDSASLPFCFPLEFPADSLDLSSFFGEFGSFLWLAIVINALGFKIVDLREKIKTCTDIF
jgi:hypothetical protein